MRIEKNSMGGLDVPEIAIYRVKPQREIHNFPVSGKRLPDTFIRSFILTKEKRPRREPMKRSNMLSLNRLKRFNRPVKNHWMTSN